MNYEIIKKKWLKKNVDNMETVSPCNQRGDDAMTWRQCLHSPLPRDWGHRSETVSPVLLSTGLGHRSETVSPRHQRSGEGIAQRQCLQCPRPRDESITRTQFTLCYFFCSTTWGGDLQCPVHVAWTSQIWRGHNDHASEAVALGVLGIYSDFKPKSFFTWFGHLFMSKSLMMLCFWVLLSSPSSTLSV